MAALQIRPMTRAELGFGSERAAQGRWNPGPQGGRARGIVSAARHSAGFGFIGFDIVRLEGRAIGLFGATRFELG
jgi:hypothetical protein